MKVKELSKEMQTKILSGEIPEYIPNKKSYKQYIELAKEYRDKAYEWIRKNGDITGFIEEHGYLVKPDSPKGLTKDLDLFRTTLLKRFYQESRQTPRLKDALPWGSIKGLKSPFSLQKIQAHHVRGLIQESPFLAGLPEDKAMELVNRMWESGRIKSGSQFYNRIDLEKYMHQNPYEAKLLEKFRKLDPDAGAYVDGKWVGWEKKGSKWTNPLYKGTGIHELLAEHGISNISGGTMFSDDTQGLLRNLGDNIDARFNAWSTWYDYTDEQIERLLFESQINPRNLRQGLTARKGFSEMAKVAKQSENILQVLRDAYDLTPEADLLLQNRLLGPDPKRQPKLDKIAKKGDVKVLEKTRQQTQEIENILRRSSQGGLIPDAAKVADDLGVDVVQKGGKSFLKKYGKQIAVAGVGFSAWNMVDNVQAAVRDPSKANLTRVGLSGVETLAEGVSAAGILAAPVTGGASLTVVPAAEGVSTAAGAGELGSYLVEHRKKIWSAVKDPDTYRQLAGNTKDFFVEKATDDKGISSLWSKDEEKKPPEAVYWR